jgi:putative lipoic acid-binding regulatory protein
MGAVIKTTKSKTGKFTSVSVDVQVKDSQEIIDKYLEVSTLKGSCKLDIDFKANKILIVSVL